MKLFCNQLTVLLILFAFFVINPLEGQRVGFDTETFPISYLELPTHPVDFEYTAYSASISVRPDQLRVMGTNEMNLLGDYVDIPGLTKVNSNGFFHIEIILDNFNESDAEVKSGAPTPSRRGPAPSRDQKPVHFVEVTIGMPVALKITDYNGDVLFESLINDGTDTRTYRSREFSNSAGARTHWNRNGSNDMRSFRNRYLSEFFEEISKVLVERYGYREQTNISAVFEVLGNRRHPSYDAHQANFQIVKEALSQLKYNQPIPEEIFDEVHPVIEFWKDEMKGLDPEERQERRLMYSCLFNLATTYYWIEDLDNAVKYLEKLEELDMRSGTVGYLSNRIHSTRSLFESTGFTTKHLSIEELIVFDESTLPEVTYSTEQDLMHLRAREDRLAAEGVREGAEEFSGYVYYSDGRDPLRCKFYLNPSRDGELSLLHGESNLIVMVDEGPYFIRTPLGKTVVSGFTFDDRKFILEDYSPGMSVSLRSSPEFMEVLYDSENIQVLRYYPTSEASVGNTEREFVMRKGADDDLLSLHGRRFLNWNRGLSRYVEDCDDLSNRAGNGEFSRNTEDLIQLAKLYDACMRE